MEFPSPQEQLAYLARRCLELEQRVQTHGEEIQQLKRAFHAILEHFVDAEKLKKQVRQILAEKEVPSQ